MTTLANWATRNALEPEAVFSTTALPFISVKDAPYNAKGDGATDDTAAFQAAADYYFGLGISGDIFVPNGTYKITSSVTIKAPGVRLVGAGKFATIISFQPASGGLPAFIVDHLDHSNAIIDAHCAVIGFTFTSPDVALQKIMIRLVDVEECEVADIASSSGNWTGNNSIGLQVMGRQTVYGYRLAIAADTPISIDQNPDFNNHEGDHLHFSDTYLIASGTNPCFNVSPNALISDLLIDGDNAWIAGGYGFAWPGATGVVGAAKITIKNVRWEQSTNAAGYIVYIAPSTTFLRVNLENISGGTGANHKGFYFRNCSYVTLLACTYSGTAEALNIDGTVSEYTHINTVFASTSTVAIAGQNEIFALNRFSDSNTPLPLTVVYSPTANLLNNIRINGTKMKSAQGTIASGAGVSIPIPFGGAGENSFYIIVSARNTTTGLADGGAVVVSNQGGAAGAVLVSGTPNFVAGNVGGKLSVFYNSATDFKILNNLANQVSYVVTVFWL